MRTAMVLAALTVASTSSAQDRANKLRSALSAEAAETTELRRSVGVVAAATGGATLAVSGVLFSRAQEPAARVMPWMGATGGGVLVISGLVLLAIKTPLEDLAEDCVERRVTAEACEQRWAQLADRERSMRKATAVISYVAGGLFFGSGIAWIALDGDRTRASFGVMPVFLGALYLTVGAVSANYSGNIERGYRVFRNSVSASVVPLPKGGAASVAIAF